MTEGATTLDGGLRSAIELAGYYPELAGHSLVCVTELHDRTAIDGLAAALRS